MAIGKVSRLQHHIATVCRSDPLSNIREESLPVGVQPLGLPATRILPRYSTYPTVLNPLVNQIGSLQVCDRSLLVDWTHLQLVFLATWLLHLCTAQRMDVMRELSHYGPRSGFSYPELGASKNVEPYQDSLDRSQDVSNINCGLEERRIMIGKLFRLTRNEEKKFILMFPKRLR